jgi:hypothetical protein
MAQALILKRASASRRPHRGNAVAVDARYWHHKDRTPTHGYETTREAGMSLISLNVAFRGNPAHICSQ